jgi:hypothetical protein
MASDDPITIKSISGYAITYASCPIYWALKLQTEITLSTTEVEYVSLSPSLHDTIPLMALLHEIKSRCDENIISTRTVHCTVFEDNSGVLKLSNVPKMRPRMKYIKHQIPSFLRACLCQTDFCPSHFFRGSDCELFYQADAT